MTTSFYLPFLTMILIREQPDSLIYHQTSALLSSPSSANTGPTRNRCDVRCWIIYKTQKILIKIYSPYLLFLHNPSGQTLSLHHQTPTLPSSSSSFSSSSARAGPTRRRCDMRCWIKYKHKIPIQIYSPFLLFLHTPINQTLLCTTKHPPFPPHPPPLGALY